MSTPDDTAHCDVGSAAALGAGREFLVDGTDCSTHRAAAGREVADRALRP